MIDLEADQSGIGLRQYLQIVRRRKWIIFAVLVASVAAAATLSFRAQSMYRATTKIVVGQGNSLFQPDKANAVQPFTATMSDLLESNIVAARVISDLGLAQTPQEFLEDVSVSINPETAVLRVDVTASDPELAQDIAAHIGVIFSDLVRERFGATAPTAVRQDAQPPLTATVWDPAHVDADPVSPKPLRNIALAGVLGLILGLLGAFLRDHFDRSLRDRDSVEHSFGVPVIGQIPLQRGSRKRAWKDARTRTEAFQALRANLQYLAVKRPLQTILITSASAQQGKSTVTANLALAVARSGASVVVVEADLRRPNLGSILGVRSTRPGLTSFLVGASNLDSALVEIPPAAGGGDGAGRVHLLPSGPLPPNPSELLSSTQMTELLDRLAVSFDYVLIDSPPLLPVADALELARLVHGVILVVRRNHATSDQAREVRALVERLDISLVGSVLTGAETGTDYSYYSSAERERVDGREPVLERREQVEGTI